MNNPYIAFDSKSDLSYEFVTPSYQLSVLNGKITKKRLNRLIKFHREALVDMTLLWVDQGQEHTLEDIVRQARKVLSLHEYRKKMRL